MTDLRLVGANTVPGAAANEYEIGGAYRIAPHVHDNLKLGFLMRGAYVGDGDDALEMTGPALVYYPAMTRSGASFSDIQHHFLWVDVETQWLDRMALAHRLPARSAVISSAGALTSAWVLNAASLGPRDAHPMELESALFELLSVLAEEVEAVGEPPRWWRDALNILHEEEIPISLGEAADMLGTHPAHLARAFKAKAGCPIGEYSRRVRLSRAARDLADTAKPIAVIAAERGFYDQSHFNRHFKRAYGLAPSQYRAGRA